MNFQRFMTAFAVWPASQKCWDLTAVLEFSGKFCCPSFLKWCYSTEVMMPSVTAACSVYQIVFFPQGVYVAVIHKPAFHGVANTIHCFSCLVVGCWSRIYSGTRYKPEQCVLNFPQFERYLCILEKVRANGSVEINGMGKDARSPLEQQFSAECCVACAGRVNPALLVHRPWDSCSKDSVTISILHRGQCYAWIPLHPAMVK